MARKNQKQLEEEVPRLEAEVDVLRINTLSSDKILSEAKDLYGRWPHLNREEKQRIIESITDKIIIGQDEIAINLCYLPSSEETTTEQRRLSPSLLFNSWKIMAERTVKAPRTRNASWMPWIISGAVV